MQQGTTVVLTVFNGLMTCTYSPSARVGGQQRNQKSALHYQRRHHKHSHYGILHLSSVEDKTMPLDSFMEENPINNLG
jgi:hypothetical protein